MNPFWQKASAVQPQALTDRQREVAQLIAESHNNKSIAQVLHVGTKTAENHSQRIFRKLGLESGKEFFNVNVAMVTHWAIKYGLTAL